MGKLSKALEKALPQQGEVVSFEDADSKEQQYLSSKRPSGPKEEEFFLNEYSDTHFKKQGWDERLLLAIQTSSPIAESFKRLRSKVLHPPEGGPPRTILITSVVPEEGKGFACANLGVALAQDMEHHALMVDCDMRRPSLAAMFGLSNDSGLVDHLRNNVDLSLLLRKTGMPKLSLIPSGTPPANPAELLDSNRMSELISELANRYDDRFILLDSPPNAVASETAILAKRVDGIVLVVRWGYSRREQVKKLVELIGEDKIIGIVFNAFEENEMDSFLKKKGYYGHYNKYYSQKR